MHLLTTTIDLSAIAHNTRTVKARANGAQLMAVVKADGYNHGMTEVARVMAANGADQFGVATLEEAVALRRSGITKPILSWIWRPEQDLSAAVEAEIDLGVPSMEHAHAATAAGASRVTVKVDTGLNRSGVDEADWVSVFERLASSPVEVTGLFSHLACADDPSDPATDEQAEVFRRAIDVARKCGLEVPVNHLANSPGTMDRPDLHFQMVRPGLVLYGLEPIEGRSHGLKPAMMWSASVVVVKEIAAGEGTSYGLTWRAPIDGHTAVVSVGYADGLPRAIQDGLFVTIRGKRYPQVGRVCMDQIVVWLGVDSDVVAGDRAVLFGPGDGGEMTCDEVASALGTINYEVACSPKGRTVREFVGK